MSFDELRKKGLCMNTICNNKFEYRLFITPDFRANPDGLIRETYKCKECLIQYISGNNIQFNEDVIITRIYNE